MRKIMVLDCEHYRNEDGEVFETSSRPTIPPPDGDFGSMKYGWHSVVGKWMPLEELNVPFVTELDM